MIRGQKAMKLFFGLIVLASSLWLPASSYAQFTLVSGTVTDPNGVAYANGTINATLITPGGGSGATLNGASFNQYPGPFQMQADGSFTFRLPDNNVVQPSGTQWKFTVGIAGALPPLGTGPQSFSVTLSITGASQSISASLNPSAPKLVAAGVGGGTGTINSCATTNAMSIYTAATTLGCGNGDFTYATDTLTAAAAGLVTLAAETGANSFILPVNGNAPSVNGSLHFVTGINSYATNVGTLGYAGNGTSTGTNCGVAFSGGQFIGNISATAGPTCLSLSGANATSQKNETSTPDPNVLTVTPPAAAGTWRACATISVSAATSGIISWTLSWTDSNGNAQSNIAMPLFQFGTAAPNTTFTTSAAGNYSGCSTIDINNVAANIVVKWVGGGTTTAKMSASVERVI
jgi:hypothetical protein